jgi:hypothetical protein
VARWYGAMPINPPGPGGQSAMTAPAMLLAVAGVAGVTALVLSIAYGGKLARGLALASLWLAIAAVPTSVLWDVLTPLAGSDPTASKAERTGMIISHVMNYGALVMPFAGIAMVALRSVAARKARRAPRKL